MGETALPSPCSLFQSPSNQEPAVLWLFLEGSLLGPGELAAPIC